MIAKSSWFSSRKFGGWGLTPNCWQGWAYIGVIATIIFFINRLNLPNNWHFWLTMSIAVIVSVDFINVFVHLKKDERDIIHEALAERNAMWFMVFALGIGVVYQVSTSLNIDPVIIIALLGSVIVKGVTHWYLRNQ